MPLASETITVAGSGLVFVNTYGAGVTAAFRTAIIAAENYFQNHFTDAVTLNLSFDLQALDLKFAGQNTFYQSVAHVSYATFRAALASHATTADDLLVAAALPAGDPSAGRGFDVPVGLARILGLAGPSNSIDDSIVLNSALNWTYGQDAIGVLEHEISEGAMGRIGSLGVWSSRFAPMDLFRFTAQGVRDYTGGLDGVRTYFGLDAGHVTALEFHNPVSTSGVYDHFDFADWDFTVFNDSFGPGGPGAPGSMSTTDLRVMDVLGWTPTGAAPPPAADDYANSLADGAHPFGRVAVNGSSTGVLEISGDRDWFAIQLSAGVAYTIDLQGQHGTGGTLANPYLRLHDLAGALIAQNDDVAAGTNADSRITFTPTSAGTYYIEAGAFSDAGAGSYTVRLSASSTPGDDFANSLTDHSHPLGSVAANSSSTGVLELVGDRDWFSIQMVAGFTYTINLQGLQSGFGTLDDPYLRLHDGAGAILAENDDITTGTARESQLTFVAPGTGTFYIEAGAYADSLTGSYRVQVSAVAPPTDDFANTFTDIIRPFGAAVVGGSVGGVLEAAGDRDWFKVQLNAGFTYTIDLLGQQGGGGTLGDPLMRLHDSTGALVATNDDIASGGSLDSELTLSVTTSGFYYIEAGAYGDSATGSYHVRIASAVTTPDDFANSLADSSHPLGLLSVNGSATGALEVAGDRDWFRVQLTAGVSYNFTELGESDGAGTLTDPYLRLHNAGGTVVAQSDDLSGGINFDSQLTFVAPTTGFYYLEAAAYADSGTGTYTVQAFPTPADDFANALTDAAHPIGTVAVGGVRNGALETLGDRDWVSVQLLAGVNYSITLSGQHGNVGTLADPYLRIHDNQGVVVAENDDIDLGVNRDSRVSFTPAVTGTYYLEAGSFDDSYTGTYQFGLTSTAVLTTTRLTPVFLGTVGSTGIYRLDLTGIPLSTIASIRILDDSVVSGGTGGASGFDLDFVRLSTTLTSSASTAATLAGLNVFDFTTNVSFQPGFLQAWNSATDPAFWNTNALFGTTAMAYDAAKSTLGVLDGDNNSANGALSLGEGGSVTLRLTSNVNPSGVYLYYGDVGSGNDGSYVILSSQPNLPPPAGVTITGTVGVDDLRLGQGLNAHLGGGDDTVDGSGGDDLIATGPGNDTLIGGPGNDQLNGGTGADTASYQNDGAVVVNLSLTGPQNTSGAGVDTLTNIENLTGSANNDVLYGNTGPNILTGLAGNDFLDGRDGADAMAGGPGNDAYIVDNPGDIAQELVGEGYDTLYTSVDYVLGFGASIDLVVLMPGAAAAVTGNDLPNQIVGNELPNTLFGLDGADYLRGGAGNDALYGGAGEDLIDGESGADAMAGGPGNDTYLLDNPGDTVTEAAAEGYDTVYTYVNFTIAAGQEIEVVVALDGQGATTLTGNELGNQLVGNSGANVVHGMAGDDFVRGGAGNDQLFGDAGNDLIDGESGADSMAGGTGNDTFLVDNAGDVVTENAGEGYDTVYTNIDMTLSATSEVEMIFLYGNAHTVTGSNTDNQILGAQGDDTLNGLGGADFLRGGDGSDTLNGGIGADLLDGGFGLDTLTGGADADIFLFSRSIDAGDTITDFQTGLDRIFIDHAGFGLAAGGTLAQAGVAFQLGTAATGSGPALVYDAATGTLLWDADGAGALAAVTLAHLTGHPTLGADSFGVA